MKNKKNERLSFRISEDLSDKINTIISLNPNIRDRSDLGHKALEFYIHHLSVKEKEQQKIISEVNKLKQALRELSDFVNFTEINQLLDN